MKSDWTRPRPIGLGCENRGMNFADSAPPRSWSYWSRLGQGGCNVLSNRNLTNMDAASITGDEILHQKTATFVASSLPIHCWDIHNGAFLDIEKKIYIYISGHVLFKLINRLTKKPPHAKIAQMWDVVQWRISNSHSRKSLSKNT